MIAGQGSRASRIFGALRSLFGAAVVGGAFELLGVPAGMLLGSIVGAAIVNQRWFPSVRYPARLPSIIQQVGLMLVGLAAGALLTVETLLSTASIALPIVVSYLGLALINLVLISLLMLRYGMNPSTAVLATAPGGLAEMLSMAVDKGADLEIVVTIQTVRLITLVLFLLPILVVVFS